MDASSYLERAKKRLSEDTHESLFYAAYEVRCAVEARQDEYLQAQEKYASSIPKAWRIKAQGEQLERIFASDRIQRIEWKYGGGQESFVAYHVPVTEKPRRDAEGINDLLHAQLRTRKFYDRWWGLARRRVVAVYRGVWTTCHGKLLSPVLRSREEGRLLGNVVMTVDTEEAKRFAAWQRPGATVMIGVSYLNEPPPEWTTDDLASSGG